MTDTILYHPDPSKSWIIKTDASKTAFACILLQPHISYNFTGTQQAWSATECKLHAIYITMHKLSYMMKGGKVTIRTDHKPLLEIVAGTAKA